MTWWCCFPARGRIELVVVVAAADAVAAAGASDVRDPDSAIDP